MAATLNLIREGAGVELRRGTFQVTVDGAVVGSIEYRETIEVMLAPGRHTLRLRAGRYSSKEHAFQVGDGEMMRFRCHGAMIWPRYVLSIFKPDTAISLKPV